MSVILYPFTCSGTPGCCIIAYIDSEGKPQIILSARPRLVYHLNVDSVVVITGVLTHLGKICKSIKQKLHDYFLFSMVNVTSAQSNTQVLVCSKFKRSSSDSYIQHTGSVLLFQSFAREPAVEV